MPRLLTVEEFVEKIRISCEERGQQAFAAEIGVSPSFLNDILHGRRDKIPSDRLARTLGYKRVVHYVKLTPAERDAPEAPKARRRRKTGER